MFEKDTKIFGLQENLENLMVQKSRNLLALRRSDWTLPEFKLLDVYTSRINSHTPEKRTVVFTKSELEHVLQVSNITAPVLSSKLDHMMQPITLTRTKSIIDKMVLFERAIAYKNESGNWEVEMTCTPSALKVFFSIEEEGYIKYKLESSAKLGSLYSYHMFTYIEENRFRVTWVVDVEELKYVLNCEKDETYKEYKRFNDLILKKAHAEIKEKTKCDYTYEPIKKGRTVIAIKFTVKAIPGITDVGEMPEGKIIKEETIRNISAWEDAVKEFNFTEEQIRELQSYILCIPTSLLLFSNSDEKNTENGLLNYMKTKVAEVKRIGNEKKINNVYAYLLSIIKNDIKSKEPDNSKKSAPMTKSANNYNNYPQRHYSEEELSELERKLLSQM